MCCQILNIGYLLLKALKFIFECMAEKDEKKKYSLLSGKEMKGRRFSHYPVLLNLLLSPDPEIWESKIKCNKYNESNDNLILTLTQVDLIT